MKRYEFMVLEWINVEGQGQPVLATETHYLKNDERAAAMAEKIYQRFNVNVAIVIIEGGQCVAMLLPVARNSKAAA